MPRFYNQKIHIDGRVCFDGGLINPVPIIEAIENGCTDILVLLTRPADFRDTPPTRFEKELFNRRCALGNTSLMDAFANRHVRANYLRDVALGRTAVLPDVHIAAICPSGEEPAIEWTETNTRKLKNAAIASARRTLEAFGYVCDEFVEVLRPFPYISRYSRPALDGSKIHV
jgi:predicted patatin/cPLA2 family phospholipase